MSANSPFAILQDFESRCRANAAGLPTGEVVEDDWIGIGFGLCGQRLVAKMSDVTEILPPPDTIRVPGVLSWVTGLANVRGTLLPILDMGAYLNGEFTQPGKECRVLIINKNNVIAGLLVEEVFGMRRFKPELKEESSISGVDELNPYLEGGFSDTQFKWNIFDVEKLVSHEKFLRVV
ncbi:MAG: purine-binding chemotaxis protein CheW [Gammaproteobacteria bacterium]|nr:purine-binding chemotaxis protein CheW [Gammaproteobacteria bacterium]